MINKENYEEYIESLLNAARLTKKENSVLINFKVEDETCTNTVDFIQQDGTKDTFKNSTFMCDDTFYKEFLEKFVVAYSKNMVVAFNDNININSNGKYTYRVITDDNDMMSIDGITLEYANYLAELTKKEVQVKDDIVTNENGNVTFMYSLFLLGMICMAMLATILLLS